MYIYQVFFNLYYNIQFNVFFPASAAPGAGFWFPMLWGTLDTAV